MGFFGVFLFCLGALCVATAADCVPETAKCSKYWVKMLPHTNLMAKEEDLNLWCSKQDRFYQCLEDVFLEGKNGNLSYLPTNLLISKLFAQDLCSDSSKNRERLLSNAECINQLNTDFCILPEYLDIVTPDDAIPSTRCSQAEKTFSCIAATIVLNCGFDAGRVYRAMLKITRYSDEVCDIEMSDGIPPCEGSYSKSVDREKKLSEIYYGFFHRIGNLLDEQNDPGLSVSEESSEDGNEAITEAIQSAIDNLDENLVSEELFTPEHDSTQSQSSCTEDIKEYKPYMKNPHITEVHKGILLYNYSGIEYALYWRQPLYNIFDTTVCKHLLPRWSKSSVFQCRTNYRYKDPDCLSNSTFHEKITPEFIRSFDPEVPCDSVAEFGPRPEWMKEVDEMYEEQRIRDQMKSTSPPVTTEMPEFVTKSSTLLHLVSTESFESYQEYYRKNFDTEGYKYDIRKSGLNSPFPNDLHIEIWEMSQAWHAEGIPVPITSRIRVGNSMFILFYNWNITDAANNMTCSRIDECHPRGRGVWKCKWWPREAWEDTPCDNCEEKQKPITYEYEIYARPAAEFEKLNNPDATESSSIDESSVLESTTPFIESIALTVDRSENESEQIKEIHLMKDEAYSEDESDKVQYNIDSDVDNLQYEILNIFDQDEEVETSKVVYAIEGTDDMEDGESDIIISTDGLLDGDIILVSNISDLDETKYTVVSAPPDFTE